MKLKYKHIGLTVKTGLSHKDEVVQQIIRVVEKAGAHLCVDARRCKNLPSADNLPRYDNTDDIDLLIVVGGDGTILRAVRELTNREVPILGVNRGNIGFLSEVHFEEAADVIPLLLKGDAVIEQRSLLHIDVVRDGKKIHSGLVLNEAVIAQGSIARLLYLRASIDDEPLTTFRSDGLIIATPTGSTAYSLAAGGPIVHPLLSAVILTPLNPYSFSQKPLVIPATQTIDVQVAPKSGSSIDTDVNLTLDGQTVIGLEPRDIIRAHSKPHAIKFLRRKKDAYFATLRSKLRWGESEK